MMVGLVTIALFMTALPSPAHAQGVITVRLLYKIILSPDDGSRPALFVGPVANADIDDAIAAMNDLYETYFRGYRFLRVGPITTVGGAGAID